ncbi:UvrD-helicase domain-containing protein, partial [Pseudomonas aeruginosa]
LLDEDRINHLMVDEFQDTSPSQFELLQRLVAHWEDDDSRSVFFCGDGFQSIYLFRAATVELFINMVMSKVFGPKSLENHRLTVNFRSAPGVVEWNNRAYGKVFAKS